METDKGTAPPSWLSPLVCLLPFALLFVAYALGIVVPFWLYVLVLLWCLLVPMWHRGRPGEDDRRIEAEAGRTNTKDRRILGSLTDAIDPALFEVTGGEVAPQGFVLRGRPLTTPDLVRQHVAGRARAVLGREPQVMLHETGDGQPYLFIPNADLDRALIAEVPPRRPLVNLSLFAATLVTTTFAGAAHQGVNLLQNPGVWTVGLPYAIGIMLILGIHEMGHYLAARYHGIPVSLPYFIPVPFALGTFGAFIRLPPVVKTRRQLFDIGVAGPLAGLLVAIPALALGLRWSTVLPVEPTVAGHMAQGLSVSTSVLLAVVAKVVLGSSLLQGHYLVLHPLAFAGWLGLMVTALNLLPVGQLDGGHIAHALFGRARAEAIGTAALLAMVVLGLFVWSGLLFWALVVFFIAGTSGMPPNDDVTTLNGWRRAIAWSSFTLLALILLPFPHGLSSSLGLHCPYL